MIVYLPLPLKGRGCLVCVETNPTKIGQAPRSLAVGTYLNCWQWLPKVLASPTPQSYRIHFLVKLWPMNWELWFCAALTAPPDMHFSTWINGADMIATTCLTYAYHYFSPVLHSPEWILLISEYILLVAYFYHIVVTSNSYKETFTSHSSHWDIGHIPSVWYFDKNDAICLLSLLAQF